MQTINQKIAVTLFFIVGFAAVPSAQVATTVLQKKNEAMGAQAKVAIPAAQPKAPAVKSNVIAIKEADLQFEVPAGWRTQPQKDATQITSPDGGVSIIIGLAVNDDTEAMIAGLKDYLKQDYRNFKAGTDLQKEEINGLHALIENGTGETSQGTMEWNIVVLLGGKRPVIAFTVAEQKAFRSSQSDYIKLVQSIKKVDGSR